MEGQFHKFPLLSNSSNSAEIEEEDNEIHMLNGVGDFVREFSIESKKVLRHLPSASMASALSPKSMPATSIGTIKLAAVSVENSVIAGLGCGILASGNLVLYGMLLGLACQCGTLLWVTCTTNWNKEVYSAEKRLQQWVGET